MFNFSIITKRYRIPKYEFFARADMIKIQVFPTLRLKYDGVIPVNGIPNLPS
jgi:hypothetical protein